MEIALVVCVLVAVASAVVAGCSLEFGAKMRKVANESLAAEDEWDALCKRLMADIEKAVKRNSELIAECERRSAQMAVMQEEIDRLRGDRNEACAVAYAAGEYVAGRISHDRLRQVVENQGEQVPHAVAAT